MNYAFGKNSIRHRRGVDKRLGEISNLALQISIIDFGIPSTGGVRTAAEQRKLFNEGLSMCDGTDKKSKHQSGMALDFYAYVDGKASWDEGDLTLVATAFLQAAALLGYKLQWGGLWEDFRDMPHVELIEELS